MLHFTTPKHHWNYFLAIAQDLEFISRYIEFCENNQDVYSIELAHIMLSASSEIDVVMKLLCGLADNTKPVNNINDYKAIIKSELPELINEEISINRFGLTYKPWINWEGDQNPDWWKSYNCVKHQRNDHFNEANLKNTINAVGALLIVVVYYYKFEFQKEAGHEVPLKDVTRNLVPTSSFLKISNEDYYYNTLIA